MGRVLSEQATSGVTATGLISVAGPELAQLTVVTLWASTFVITKGAFAEVSPLAFAFVRFLLMTLLAFAVLAARGGGRMQGARRADWPRFVAAGVSGYTLYQLGFVLGLERTSPFSSSLLIAMVPLFTVMILAVMGERTPLRGWLGIGVALAGAVVFLSDKGGGGTRLGDAFSLGAAVAFALYGVVNRPLVARYPPETYTAYTVLAGSVPLLAVSTPAALAQDWGAVSAWGWIAIVYMVVLPVYVAYMLWNWAIARRGVAAATGFSLLVPIVSGALSALLFDEGFGAAKLLGAALVLGGLVLLRLPPRKPRPSTG
ncbi:MAG: DMT family transporter [Actinomycetota bacterium]|nr:DMT family transporter [Actinomycetota bacterium]